MSSDATNLRKGSSPEIKQSKELAKRHEALKRLQELQKELIEKGIWFLVQQSYMVFNSVEVEYGAKHKANLRSTMNDLYSTSIQMQKRKTKDREMQELKAKEAQRR
jgi:hypothetical protein